MAKKKVEDKNAQNGDSKQEGNASDDEPSFSDPENYVDDITDEGKHFALHHVF